MKPQIFIDVTGFVIQHPGKFEEREWNDPFVGEQQKILLYGGYARLSYTDTIVTVVYFAHDNRSTSQVKFHIDRPVKLNVLPLAHVLWQIMEVHTSLLNSISDTETYIRYLEGKRINPTPTKDQVVGPKVVYVKRNISDSKRVVTKTLDHVPACSDESLITYRFHYVTPHWRVYKNGHKTHVRGHWAGDISKGIIMPIYESLERSE